MEALRLCADCWACSRQQLNKNAPNICFMHHFHLSARRDLMGAGLSPVHVLYTHVLPLNTPWKHTLKMARVVIAFIIWHRWCEDVKSSDWWGESCSNIEKSDPVSNFMLLKHTLLTLTSFSVILLFAPLGFYSRSVPPPSSQSVTAPNRS